MIPGAELQGLIDESWNTIQTQKDRNTADHILVPGGILSADGSDFRSGQAFSKGLSAVKSRKKNKVSETDNP